MKRARWLLLLALLVVRTCLSQTDLPATSPEAKSADEVKSFIASTYERNAIASITAPYHFRATFETFDRVGKTSGSGSIERWSSSPQLMKTVTSFGEHTMTEYAAAATKGYTDTGFTGNIMFYFVHLSVFYGILPPLAVIHRVPQATNIVALASGDTLDCQAYTLTMGPREYPQPPSDRFCVSRATNDLVLRHTENLTIRYSDFAPFLDKSIARTIEGSQGSQVRFRVKVEQLDQVSLPSEQMTAPADASPTSPQPNMWATKPEDTRPIHAAKVAPPPDLKASHVTGVVVSFYLIDRSGNVIDVEPRFATSPELAAYAAEALKATSYKPILRNGKPEQEIASSYLTFVF